MAEAPSDGAGSLNDNMERTMQRLPARARRPLSPDQVAHFREIETAKSDAREARARRAAERAAAEDAAATRQAEAHAFADAVERQRLQVAVERRAATKLPIDT
jgi:hypothetical protein